MISYVETL